MAVKFGLKMIGLKELENQFNQLIALEERQALIDAPLREGAEKVAMTAKELVPVDEGKLKASIKVKKSLASRRTIRSTGYLVVTGRRRELGIDPDDKYYYPTAVEFGRSGGRGRGGRRVAPMAARPYLRPAIERHRNSIILALRRAVLRAVKRVGGSRALNLPSE